MAMTTQHLESRTWADMLEVALPRREAPEQIARLEGLVSNLETVCADPAMNTPNPPLFRAMRAFLRGIVADVDLIALSEDAGELSLNGMRGRLDDLRDRADELDDTLAWAEEPDALRPVVEEACG